MSDEEIMDAIDNITSNDRNPDNKHQDKIDLIALEKEVKVRKIKYK